MTDAHGSPFGDQIRPEKCAQTPLTKAPETERTAQYAAWRSESHFETLLSPQSACCKYDATGIQFLLFHLFRMKDKYLKKKDHWRRRLRSFSRSRLIWAICFSSFRVCANARRPSSTSGIRASGMGTWRTCRLPRLTERCKWARGLCPCPSRRTGTRAYSSAPYGAARNRARWGQGPASGELVVCGRPEVRRSCLSYI